MGRGRRLPRPSCFSPRAREVEIDRGTDAGVDKGMPVVTGAGLVGRVVEASKRRATVLLITDLSSNIGVRLTASGDVGVAKGAGAGNDLPVDRITQVRVLDPYFYG